jgi:replication initiation and membrane attachment protein DnaB
MKRFEMLKHITYNQILETVLTADEINEIMPEVQVFMAHDHKLPTPVINVILSKALIMTKNKGRLPNAAYMRMVAESFKAEGATTLTKAIEKMDRDKEYALKQVRNNEPSWVEEYVQELRKKESEL